MHKFYTVDEKLKKHPNFKNIEQTLDRLCQSDVVDRLAGNCISACDILQNMLSFYDIDSKIIECQAMAIKSNEQIKDFRFIGFSNIDKREGVVDSHVIIVTQTEPPILIDASIGYLLPQDNQILVKVLDNVDPEKIATYQIDDVTLTYHHKKHIKLPNLHQKNILERIQTDNKIFKNLGMLKILVIVALIVSGLNAIRGFYDFYQKYVGDNHLIGISANEEILERIDKLEKRLKSKE
jgi:hypothetical protein